VIHALQEGEDVTALAAAEAVIEPNLRSDMKTWASLLVKRTQTLHRTDTGALERDVVANDVGDVGARPDFVDIALSNQASHTVILRSGVRRYRAHKTLVPCERRLVCEGCELIDDCAFARGIRRSFVPVTSEPNVEPGRTRRE